MTVELIQFIYFILGVNSLNTGEHEVPPVCQAPRTKAGIQTPGGIIWQASGPPDSEFG